jgi:D-alanyl-D-alanine carboxypeptidase
MPTQTTNTSTNSTQTTNKVEITDWKLRLANYDNLLPEDFEVELANIDNSKDPKQFDARAVKYLKDMINAMKKDGNTKIWCQSTFRSVKRQKELYDASVQKYLKQGKTQEEADKLTLEYINKPGGSDHNLGLAVDFNYVDNSFAKTSEYKWLLKNAENYGFILRYPEDKEDKTKIAYESWHWRYVGEENAKRMNELNMCLEEYVEYLQKGNK